MAYINKQDVAQIRKELKEAFPNLTFSVRKDHSSSVVIAIMKGNIDFLDINGTGHAHINHYHTNMYTDEQAKVFEEILEIAKTAPTRTPEGGVNPNGWFDKSDIMTDYFHTAYYINIEVGKWDKDYVYVGSSTPAKKADEESIKALDLVNKEIESVNSQIASYTAKLAVLEVARKELEEEVNV